MTGQAEHTTRIGQLTANEGSGRGPVGRSTALPANGGHAKWFWEQQVFPRANVLSCLFPLGDYVADLAWAL